MSEKLPSSVPMELDEAYDRLQEAIREQVDQLTHPLFETDASPQALWAHYLESIPAQRRQHYNCYCCRRFIQKYGGLVTIEESGTATPALWGFQPPSFFAQ